MSKKNELSLLEQEQAKVNPITDNLVSALSLRAGKHIETKVNSDGKEYLSATFILRAPTKEHTSITVNDMELASRLEKLYNFEALGEVSSIASCKEMANFADTDASSLGFKSTPDMLQAIFGKGKSTLANYQRIGLYFVNDDYSLKGAIPQEATVSLLNQLLSFVKVENEAGEPDISNVEALFQYGIITPYMKQADYKKVLTTLKAMETTKELKDMELEEVEELKKELKERMTSAPKKQEKKQEQEQEQEQESNDPQVIIGQSMSIITNLGDNFKKLGLEQEQAELVNTWLDNLYTTLADMLG